MWHEGDIGNPLDWTSFLAILLGPAWRQPCFTQYFCNMFSTRSWIFYWIWSYLGQMLLKTVSKNQISYPEMLFVLITNTTFALYCDLQFKNFGCCQSQTKLWITLINDLIDDLVLMVPKGLKNTDTGTNSEVHCIRLMNAAYSYNLCSPF